MYPHLANAYYTDTDSILIDFRLNLNFIGKNIGLFKLEYDGLNKKALFPAPKLYFIDTNLGLVSKSRFG